MTKTTKIHSQPTPGPWFFHKEEKSEPHAITVSRSVVWVHPKTGFYRPIADGVRGPNPVTADANARLIESSPDLLQFIQQIARLSLAGCDNEPEEAAEAMHGLIIRARNLCEKVEGK